MLILNALSFLDSVQHSRLGVLDVGIQTSNRAVAVNTESSRMTHTINLEDTLQSRCNLLATRLRKLAANLEDIAACDDPEGCAALESALGVQELANEFVEWYETD